LTICTFWAYFLKFRAAGGVYSEASRPKCGSYTGSGASLAPRRPLCPIIHHSGGIGPNFDNLQYLEISSVFFQITGQIFGGGPHFGRHFGTAGPETQIIFQILAPKLSIRESARKHLQNGVTWALNGEV